jgi:hypothetical protein
MEISQNNFTVEETFCMQPERFCEKAEGQAIRDRIITEYIGPSEQAQPPEEILSQVEQQKISSNRFEDKVLKIFFQRLSTILTFSEQRLSQLDVI